MSNMREDSKKEWSSGATTEHLRTGCLQRIADAVEKVAANYQRLIDDRDQYKRWYEQERASSKRLANRVAGLRGAITRLKRK
jgi:ribosomal protein S17E